MIQLRTCEGARTSVSEAVLCSLFYRLATLSGYLLVCKSTIEVKSHILAGIKKLRVLISCFTDPTALVNGGIQGF
ncbi:UNVERIFIED_CONTAM: hypothetical protein RMT77_001108 [Armadillidium vulgare]